MMGGIACFLIGFMLSGYLCLSAVDDQYVLVEVLEACARGDLTIERCIEK